MLLLLPLLALLLTAAGADAAAKNTLCSKAVIFNSYNFPSHFITKNGKNELVIQSGNGTRFRERKALDGTADSVSFEVLTLPGHFMYNKDGLIYTKKNDDTDLFKREATFKLIKATEGYFRIMGAHHLKHYVRHQYSKLKLHKWSNTALFKNDSMFSAVCTSDKQFKLDVCDEKFTLTSSNMPNRVLQAKPDKPIDVLAGKASEFRFVTPALNGNPRAVSIEGVASPGYFLTTLNDHYVMLQKRKNTKGFKEAASFKLIAMRNGLVRLQSVRNPRHYVRHRELKLRIDRWADTVLYDGDSAWKLKCHVTPCESKHFVYDEKYEQLKGPHCEFSPPNWKLINNWCEVKKENRPSPINVPLQACRAKSAKVKPIKLGQGWHSETKFVIRNNGHSLQGDAIDSSKLIVSGGHLTGIFNCFQFHFHWGSEASMARGMGSEHRLYDLTGTRLATPMEVHIVCKRQSMTLTAALKTPDAIAVLAAFIHPKQPKEHDGWAGHVIAQVLLKFSKLVTPAEGAAAKNATEAVELQLRDLLPESIHRFVNYDGAFTTPNCNPVAQWHIFPDQMKIRPAMLKKFTKAFFDTAKKRPMVDNSRPVSPLFGRELRCSFSAAEVRKADMAKATEHDTKALS